MQLRTVSKAGKILPGGAVTTGGAAAAGRRAAAGDVLLGNLMRKWRGGASERHGRPERGLINIVTIFPGCRWARSWWRLLLQPQTLGILLLGVIAFGIGTVPGC